MWYNLLPSLVEVLLKKAIKEQLKTYTIKIFPKVPVFLTNPETHILENPVFKLLGICQFPFL